MKSFVTRYVRSRHIFYRLKSVFILSDAPKSNAEPVVEIAIGYADIGAVGLHGNTIISIRDIPAVECYVI
jgi:hypothetical protein